MQWNYPVSLWRTGAGNGKGLALISGHYETGEPLPDAMLEKLLAAKNFQSAMAMVRQLEFALFDFRMHKEYQPGLNIQDMLDNVRKQVAVVIPPSFNRFQNSFSHIFRVDTLRVITATSGQKSCQRMPFSLFEEHGIFDRATVTGFSMKSLRKAVLVNPWNCSLPSADVSHRLTPC